jgi:chaperone modulatory protein CbpM
MNTEPTRPPVSGTLLEQQTELSLTEVSRSCAVQVEFVIELVEQGVLAPVTGHEPANWRFTGAQLRHVTVAWRLQRDLGVNLAGAALALQLLDEIETLRAQVTASAQVAGDD